MLNECKFDARKSLFAIPDSVGLRARLKLCNVTAPMIWLFVRYSRPQNHHYPGSKPIVQNIIDSPYQSFTSVIPNEFHSINIFRILLDRSEKRFQWPRRYMKEDQYTQNTTWDQNAKTLCLTIVLLLHQAFLRSKFSLIRARYPPRSNNGHKTLLQSLTSGLAMTIDMLILDLDLDLRTRAQLSQHQTIHPPSHNTPLQQPGHCFLFPL